MTPGHWKQRIFLTMSAHGRFSSSSISANRPYQIVETPKDVSRTPKQITIQVAISTHGDTARYRHVCARLPQSWTTWP